MAVVCVCRNVSERKVARAIAHGADSIEAVGAACGAGTCCQGCQATLESLLAERAPGLATPGRVAIA